MCLSLELKAEEHELIKQFSEKRVNKNSNKTNVFIDSDFETCARNVNPFDLAGLGEQTCKRRMDKPYLQIN